MNNERLNDTPDDSLLAVNLNQTLLMPDNEERNIKIGLLSAAALRAENLELALEAASKITDDQGRKRAYEEITKFGPELKRSDWQAVINNWMENHQ
jgi:hypothetical protein